MSQPDKKSKRQSGKLVELELELELEALYFYMSNIYWSPLSAVIAV